MLNRPVVTRRTLLQMGTTALCTFAKPREAKTSVPSVTPPRFVTQWGKRGKAEGEFDILIGIAINRHDEILVTEFRNNRVQKFDTRGRFISSFPVQEYPGGIAVDREGRVYVAHMLSGIIGVYDAKGKPLHQWGENGKESGQFLQPGGIAIAHNSTLFIADQVNRRVQQFTPEGTFLRTWGEYGVEPGQFGGNENPANRTGGPQFVAVDKHDNVYTTEGSVGRVQKFSAEGNYLLSWGDNGIQPGGFGGRAKNLPGPIAITVDRQENVWVSATNHWVQQFTNTGKFLQRLGGLGEQPGQFRTPHGLAFDSRGNLYVCDTQNARIQKFALSK